MRQIVCIPFSHAPRDGGIMVSMVAFQAVDPGSIPGHRNFVYKISTNKININDDINIIIINIA